jgi:hypothetical protein
VLNSADAVELKCNRKYLCEVKRKWENKMSKIYVGIWKNYVRNLYSKKIVRMLQNKTFCVIFEVFADIKIWSARYGCSMFLQNVGNHLQDYTRCRDL